MADRNDDTSTLGLHWHTRLIAPASEVPAGFRSLAPAVHRGSTVVFDRLSEAVDDWRQAARYTYGLYGTPTTLELGKRIAALDRAYHCFVAPGGQAAIALVFLAYCRAGAHVLVPESAYGPTAELGEDLLAGLGIDVERYDPLIGGGIAAQIRPTTALIWCESPCSITMEVQDVPAIAAAARARGIAVALDNTYAAGVLFDACANGVDVSVQALTKYVGGHSDLLLGAVSVAHEDAYACVGRAHRLIGMAVSPDDCALALRGLQTLGVRLERLERSTLTVARWLKDRPEVVLVLHPALPDCPGHAIWARDFTGSASVFSIVLRDDWTAARTARFVDALRLFRIGFSWGGVTSLVMAYLDLPRLGARRERLVRLNVGLEEPADLIEDLRRALDDSS
ncbi:MAG: cystathionine beta-lyase [Acidobacteriota bacterium]|nr:cystathionine beta-lyase [Acidobacteriota bacterium]